MCPGLKITSGKLLYPTNFQQSDAYAICICRLQMLSDESTHLHIKYINWYRHWYNQRHTPYRLQSEQ